MKLAYTIATPEVERMPFAWVGNNDDFLPKLAQMGYKGVELQVRDPAAFDADAFAAKVKSHGLTICAVSTGAIGESENMFFTSPEPEKRKRAIERYKAVIDLAAKYGADCSIGRFRGMMKWAPTRDEGIAWFRSALDEFIPLVEARGIRLVLEPQHRMNLDFLNSMEETNAFIDSFQTKALKFEADIFHLGLVEKSIPAALVTAMRGGHMTFVQVSDSNRLPPGMGFFNWVDVFETLRVLGYDGWVSVESKQFPDSERAARHSFNFLNAILTMPAGLA